MLLPTSDLLRRMPAKAIEDLLPTVRKRNVPAGEPLFQIGDPGDALFIVANGRIQIKAESGSSPAEMGEAEAFGEMTLVTCAARAHSAGLVRIVHLLNIDLG